MTTAATVIVIQSNHHTTLKGVLISLAVALTVLVGCYIAGYMGERREARRWAEARERLNVPVDPAVKPVRIYTEE